MQFIYLSIYLSFEGEEREEKEERHVRLYKERRIKIKYAKVKYAGYKLDLPAIIEISPPPSKNQTLGNFV